MLDTLLFDGWKSPIRIVIMAIFIYGYLILIMRLSGKRTMFQYNMFDVIISVAYGSTIATILTTDKISFIEGAFVLGMLTFIQLFIAVMEMKSKKFGAVINPTPTFLYYNGEYCEEALKKERVLKSEIRNAARQQGSGSMELIEAVVLEGNGMLSLIPKSKAGAMDTLIDAEHIK
ncbi:DUF421 domain-containing protein [Planococcus sp. CPCC 101016]|uniref:DUF421 domain-containing protein n=1 Tax=Planococcus sp. CPCC 101016 TaxID=2599617 RepID=UPI0011B440AB|nr:YetF domain-containing protein [Planococcus sp. CPCC 101016]TWT05561.1 DUF421 domain-containing protein [Planococcus sp. CPCC 101016]